MLSINPRKKHYFEKIIHSVKFYFKLYYVSG